MKKSKHRALYFGCLDTSRGGHYLHNDGSGYNKSSDPKKTYPDFPWEIGHLDGQLLKNGKVPDRPTGQVSWTCGGKPNLWFAFYWWDRTGDSRPNSNSGFYVRGFEIGEEKELCLMSSKQNLFEFTVEWLSAIMAGEDFIFAWGDGGYTFTWDLPNMTHRIAEGFHEAYGATAKESKIYPRVVGESKWGKFLIKRVR